MLYVFPLYLRNMLSWVKPDTPSGGNKDKNRTFKYNKKISPENTKQIELQKYTESTLGSGNLRIAVALPEGEDLNEWLAVNSKSPSNVLYVC